MASQKPVKLVELLHNLMAETDKINIGKTYIAVVEEINSIHFETAADASFSDTIYKHLIRLSIKDYIHSGHSEASIKVIHDVINLISNATISYR